MGNQEQLFPSAQQDMSNIDEAAAHIAANAKPVHYDDRTSVAARDQGWGPIEITQEQDEVTQRAIEKSRNRHPSGFSAGPVRGESESEVTPAGHELHKPLTEDTEERGKRNVAEGRAALRLVQDK